MNLGDLKFKPEDFCEKSDENRKDCPHGVGNDWCAGTHWAGEANHILCEKLSKAPLVRGNFAMGEYFEFGNLAEPHSPSWKNDTHRARLVCIEEIEK